MLTIIVGLIPLVSLVCHLTSGSVDAFRIRNIADRPLISLLRHLRSGRVNTLLSWKRLSSIPVGWIHLSHLRNLSHLGHLSSAAVGGLHLSPGAVHSSLAGRRSHLPGAVGGLYLALAHVQLGVRLCAAAVHGALAVLPVEGLGRGGEWGGGRGLGRPGHAACLSTAAARLPAQSVLAVVVLQWRRVAGPGGPGHGRPHRVGREARHGGASVLRLRLDHPHLRVRECPVLTSGATGIVGGIVRGQLWGSNNRRGPILFASVQSSPRESVLRRSRRLGGRGRSSGTLRDIPDTSVLRLAEARRVLRLRLGQLSRHLVRLRGRDAVAQVVQAGVVYWLPHVLDGSLGVCRSNNFILPE